MNQKSHFWGVCFIKKKYLRPLYICFWIFGTLGGLFEFNFWLLKISKLCFESEFPILWSLFCKNLLILGFLDDFIHSRGIFFLVPFWPPRRHWRHMQMILSCRRDWYSRLDTLNVKIHLLFQILWTEQDMAIILEDVPTIIEDVATIPEQNRMERQSLMLCIRFGIEEN